MSPGPHLRPGGPARRWHRHFRHSLKWRLVAMFLLLAVAITGVFLVGSRQVLHNGWQALVQPLLSDYVDRLAAEIGSPPDEQRAAALAQRLPVRIRIDGPVVQWDSHPQREWSSRWHVTDAGATEAWTLARQTADGHRLRFRAQMPGGTGLRWRAWATLAALLALTLLAYATVRHLFRPLEAIGDGVQRFGRGELTQPIPVRRDDELGDLAGRLNTMAARLHRLLDGQRALLLAISHELRSPLTRARLNAELVPEGEARDALLRDLQQMRDLIADLLDSERLVSGLSALQREPVWPDALLRELLAQDFAGQAVEVQSSADVAAVQADGARLRLLLRNLIDNALRHGGGAGPVQVHLVPQESGLEIRVRDFGAGVPADQLDRLGQPFWRADLARARPQGGVGLGLFLSRRIAEAHGGTLGFRNAAPGLEAMLKLPAA